MPIPQLSYKPKAQQSWRGNNKKYYVQNNASGSGGGLKKRLKKLDKKKLLKSAAIVFGACIIIGFGAIAWISRDLPNPNRLIDRQIAQSTKIYDRSGETVLYEIHGDEKRTMVNLSDLPAYIKNSTIAVEDKDFYKHGGFSLWAMFRTAITDILRGQSAGGSTLTQQLIKNAILTPEKTITRKAKELILAYKVEQKFSKDEILQMYFNEIPYGSTAYGIEAASQRYFGKSAKDLTLAEAALLSAMPQAPSRYSPYGPNKDLLLARQRYILDLMVEQGYASKDDVEAAKNQELKFKEPSDNMTAPHFVMYIKEQLAEKYGDKMVEQDGLKIITTLDLYKQKAAEEAIAEIAPKNAEKYNASNAALISIDPKTGQILAMVGSRDYFNDEIDGQVNVTLQPRQPGSSFKPIVYTSLFNKGGYSPDTILYDLNTNFSTDPANPYTPHNYDSKNHGPVTIRAALAGSLNIPAVKAIYLSGIDNVLDLAKDLGYTTLNDKSRFGLSLVLGGGEVKLIEHTNAYSAFAREGNLRSVTGILKVEDKDGKVLEEYKDEEGKKVLEPNIARMTNSILSDNAARSYVFSSSNWLTLGSRPVAAKTGTTNDYRDAWTIGYTPSIVAGVWVGNNDNSEMKRGADGSVVAAPIWNKYMKKALGDSPIEYFKEPAIKKTGKPILDGDTSFNTIVKIDKASGLLATENTPPNFIEEKTFKDAHSILYYIDKNNPLGDKPENPAADPQFNLWEKPVLEWAKKQGYATSTPPAERDNLHIPENKPIINVSGIENNQTITDSQLNINISANAPRGINRVEYYIDENLLQTQNSVPFSLEKNISFLNNGFHKLKIKACDDIDNCAENMIEFNLSLSGGQINNNIEISLTSPANGLAIADFDFPLSVQVKTNNYQQIAKINFYFSQSSSQKLISTIQPTGDETSVIWQNAPVSGTYNLYCEAYGWNGQYIKSNETIITVSNNK